jgi:carbonic anhydrase
MREGTGSLTTPPCSEGVRWHVLRTPLTVSVTQLHMFPFPMNARPPQPLNGRVVEEVSAR